MGLRSCSCLLLLLLGLLIPAALVTCQCANTNPCILSCEGCGPNVDVPDPEDCRGYYRCLGTGETEYYPEPFDCPSGQVFNASLHLCVDGDSCQECPGVPVSCLYECPASGTAKIPSASDCNVYYVCSDGSISLTINCDASKPYFDGTQCQTDESRCCHCHPYCSQDAAVNIERVMDPQDCRRYYTCFAQGTPVDFTNCDPGTYFDAASKQCTDTVSCVTLCKNVVDPDGCIDPYTCLNAGFFAKCPNSCTPDYYYCSQATGEYQDVQSCTGGTVFHPTSHTCVSPDRCP